jgi:hypothetical protein
MLSGAPVRIKLRTRIPLKFHCNRRPLESCRRQTTYQNGPRRSGAPMSGLCSIQKTAKAKRRSPGRLPTFRPGLLFLRRHGNAPRRAASRTPPRRGRRASKKVALREHHPARSPSARPRRPQSAIARRRRRSSKRVLHDNRIVGALIKQLPLVNYVHTTSTDS